MKKKVFWLANFTLLSFFTLSTLVSTFGSPSKAYAETLHKDGFHKKSKNFVVVEEGEGGLEGTSESKAICTLNDEQVAQLDAFFKVSTFDVPVEGDTVTIAEVSGKRLTKHQLMEYLRASDASIDCRIVHRHRVFFLPVVPQLS